MNRRRFLELLAAAAAACEVPGVAMGAVAAGPGRVPGRIPNEYSLLLPGEAEALQAVPHLLALHGGTGDFTHQGTSRTLRPGEHLGGWVLIAVVEMNGVATAVMEKHVTHRGALAYLTERGGTIALIPKGIGDLSRIRPRPVDTSGGVAFQRPLTLRPGADLPGDFLLSSAEDPCYENVAALGPEYIGWSLVASDGEGPVCSLYLEADGKSRQPKSNTQEAWAPDLEGTAFDPEQYFPFAAPERYAYKHGYSKRTLLGGYLPVADTGVWNPDSQCGYEVMMLLPPGPDARPMARLRLRLPAETTAEARDRQRGSRDPDGFAYETHYWNSSEADFFRVLAGQWNHWHDLYETSMPVELPDPWLLDAARAGITLSRCSYRGLEPTYQVGEGAYTKIPERSHALFPVAHYEFIWAHQLWGLAEESRPYAQNYLDKYVLADGNFLYNTQDQVEAPLNAGIFLANAARDFWYTRDCSALLAQKPVLDRMLGYVLRRYAYSKAKYGPEDRRYGLIWGSPEADLGEVFNDAPESHPFFYANAAWTWRGLHEYAKALLAISTTPGQAALAAEAQAHAALAAEMRGLIQRSLEATIAAGTPAMRAAGLTPFEPNDIQRTPEQLSSYENHRFMMDWFLADWGVPGLDEGHLRHRRLAGEVVCGLHTDGVAPRTSNFMEHGTLAVKIRGEDYRSYLLTLYALVCFAADSGNRYAPEDAYLPGGYAGEGDRYGWSAVINSTLQPTLGLRWLLCYEESDVDLCHLQKAAPRHWFTKGKKISVGRCPTRFGMVSWSCEALSDERWSVSLSFPTAFQGDLRIHVQTPSQRGLSATDHGSVEGSSVLLTRAQLRSTMSISLAA